MSVQNTCRNLVIKSNFNSDQSAKSLHINHTQHHAELPEPDLSGALRVSHQQYKGLEGGNEGQAYSDALAVLDEYEDAIEIEGDTDMGYDDEDVSSHRGAADLRTEIASLRHSVDRIKDRIRRSDLDKESKLALWDHAVDLGWQLSTSSSVEALTLGRDGVAELEMGLGVALGGGRPGMVEAEGIEELGMEGVAGDSVMNDTDEVEATEEEREEIQKTLKDAKREVKRAVEMIESLDAGSKKALTEEFHTKLDALSTEKSLDKVTDKIEDLGEELDEAIQLKIEELGNKAKVERQQYLEKAIKAMDRVIAMDSRAHYQPEAIQLALMMQNYFRSLKAGQSADDSQMRTLLLSFEKGEANNVVQYIAGAIYEEAGKSFGEMDKILKASLKDGFLDLMASRVLEEQNELESTDNIQWTSEGQRFLTHWNPRQTSTRINEARARHDLQYLSGSSS